MADFSPAAMARIQKVVPYVEHSMRNVRGYRGRWSGRGTRGIRRFELKAVLVPGSSTIAYPLNDDGEPITDDEGVEFEVQDARGVYRGRGKDDYADPHDQGSRGEAVYRNGRWEIEWLTPHALMIRGKLTDDLETTDGTFTIDGVVVMQPTGSLIVDTDPAEPITVHNIFSWEGDDDGEVIAVWNENTGQWEAIQVECPA